MTAYDTQVEVSKDGRIWQAVEPRETVEIGDTAPANWFDAQECAQEIGATPGARVRVLVWPAGHVNDGTANGAVYIDEYTVPTVKSYAVTVPAPQGLWLLDSAAVWGVEMIAEPVAGGSRTISFGARTHGVLSSLPSDNDGVIDAGQMWIGGTEYEIAVR